VGTQYCQPSDVALYALNAIALSTVPSGEQTAACVAASTLADSYMRSRYPLPLLSYDIDVTMNVAYIAAKMMLEARGSRPMSGADDTVEKNYDRAIKWFKDVQNQIISPNVTYTSLAPNYSLPAVESPNCVRGWTPCTGSGSGGWSGGGGYDNGGGGF
jgi:phage gp36-like protein